MCDHNLNKWRNLPLQEVQREDVQLSDLNTLVTTPANTWAIFFGAGISLPSGIPTVAPFFASILAQLGSRKLDSDILLEAAIPFELCLETIRERVEIGSLLAVFESPSPNFYHYFIGSLVVAGRVQTIVTTNFDTLLEQALEQLGLQQNVDFDVYYKPQSFSTIDWESSKPRLVKLHGSISDLNSVQATLSQVASREYYSVISPTIRKIFGGGRHKRVLIMGYSCSDHFDISPAIRSLGPNLHDVLLIEHVACDRSNWRLTPIATATQHNPFKSARTGFRAYAQTDHLLAEVFKNHPLFLKAVRQSTTNKPGNSWRAKLQEWLRSSGLASSESLRSHVLGRLLTRANRYDPARISFAKSLETAERENNKDLIAQAKLSLGICHYRLGMYQSALLFQRAALRDARRWRMTKMEGQSLGNIGNIHYSANRLVLALRLQKQCLEFARRHNLKQLEANTLGNIGIVLEKQGNYAEARVLNRQAERLAQRIGDVIGTARHCFNIAQEYQLDGNHGSARRRYTIALERAQATAQEDIIVACLLGKSKMLKRRKVIERYLNEALDLSRRTDHNLFLLECLEELGTRCNEWGKVYEAQQYFEKALNLANAIDNKRAKQKYERIISRMKKSEG